MADNVLMWKTGSFALDAVQAGKLLSLKGEKLARFAKAVARAGLQLSTAKKGNVFLGTATLLRTGSRQSMRTAENTYLAFGHAGMQIASTLTTSRITDNVIKNLRRL